MTLAPLGRLTHERSRYYDLVSRVDGLTSIEEMSLVVHSPQDDGVSAMMVVAYSDESGDGRAFAVSGLLGLLPDWVELGRLWKITLDEHHLPEFHAAACEQRLAPFENYQREVRDMFQREFYGLIAGLKLWGFCAAVWQSAYTKRRADLQQFRSLVEGDFTHPYFLAFQHNVEAMCPRMDAERAPRNEPIAFVFDQQKELQGRAKQLYDSLKYSKSGNISYRHRLGSLSFDSRFCQLQLQAADVWAYESRKYVSDILIDKRPEGPRWQFKLLCEAERMNVSGFPPDSIDALIVAMQKDVAAETSPGQPRK